LIEQETCLPLYSKSVFELEPEEAIKIDLPEALSLSSMATVMISDFLSADNLTCIIIGLYVKELIKGQAHGLQPVLTCRAD